jgi:hypothetical protein
MSPSEQPDEKVGYRSPPTHTRFKSKNCANPYGRKGKPKKVPPLNPGEVVATHFAQRIEIVNCGKRQQASSLEAALCVLRAKALKGDVPALRLYLSLAEKFDLAGTLATMAREAEAKEDRVLQDAARELMLLWAQPEGSCMFN